MSPEAVTGLFAVAVALIGAVVQIQRLRAENRDQHAEGRELIHHVIRTVESIDEKVDDHGSRLAVVEDRLDIDSRRRR